MDVSPLSVPPGSLARGARAVATLAVALALCRVASASGADGVHGTIAVLEHHGGPRRAGLYVAPGLTAAAASTLRVDPTFDAPLSGPVFAQPLFVPGAGGPALVVAATQQDEVVAFDARTGARVWSRKLGHPVPLSSLPCGGMDPVGITGTPAVDPSTRTLYVDALVSPDGGARTRHEVYALSLSDGSTRPGWPVRPSAVARRQGLRFDDRVQNQRGALALVAGTLYVPFGGHYGDCGPYHGWLVAVPTARPDHASAWATGARGGGMWSPSGVASDGRRVFVATGNTFGAKRWSGGEAVLAFEARARVAGGPADRFFPRDWRALDDRDVDIGSAGPILLDLPGSTPSALAAQLGKDGKLYLLDRARLGGAGGAVASTRVAAGAIITAPAAYATARGTYVVFRGSGAGCPGGRSGDLTAVRLVPGSPPSAAVAWCAREHGKGSPMVTTDGGSTAIVWAVGAEGDGRLRGFDGDTGEVVFGGGGSADALGDVARFQAPILAGGRIFVATATGVKAFTTGRAPPGR